MAAAEPEAGQANDQPETQADQSTSDTAGQEATQKLAATQEPAAAEGETDGSPSASPEAKVAIETVEVENSNRLMLGGRADAGEAVRLYLNDEPLGDVQTGADGRWTLSTEHPMTPGHYAVRADVVGGDGSVKGRAEVRFDRVQVVEAGQQAPEAGASAAGGASGSSGQGSDVTIVSRTTGSGGASSGGAVGEGAGTSVVVIARGDNLWRIARKIYGKGVRHTVIFEANKNQIGNPHLIYPGQVFTIPVLEDDDNPNG